MTDQYFTLVFRGDIRDFKDPLKTETPFGIPIAAGIGDAFAENEELRDTVPLQCDEAAERIVALERALQDIASRGHWVELVANDALGPTAWPSSAQTTPTAFSEHSKKQ